VLVCGYCHHRNPPESRFCGQCGARIAVAAPRREERKVISVLFADLVGFTSRAEHMDVEDVHAILDPFYRLVREQLEQRGGTVEKYIGDAVVAVFGVPVAHEDDPERAVRAALAVQDALAILNARHPELDLHVRAAVTTGEALVALDVSPATGETFASGDVVNTAARLQAAAPVDGVVVGDVTYRATRHAIEYGDAYAIAAKGKERPVPCRQAVRPRSPVGDTRHRTDATPLIDRREERRVLVEVLARAQLGRSVSSVTFVGDPGIGKSRLVRELFRHIDGQPELIRWREGRSPPYGRGVTFWALGEIVKAEAGILESHELDAASAKLAETVADLVDDVDEAKWIERHLRRLVGLEAGAGLLGDRRAEAFAAWRRFIERLAQRRSTVLVFEDLHWADDALLDFIEHLVTWAADIPLLVICTARPDLLDRRPGWPGEPDRGRVIPLAPLSEDETHDLFDALLGTPRLPRDARDVLLAGAEGNPLYAEEFVRMLVDRKILVERDGEWALEQTRALPVPDSVLGIIASRLDAVPADDKVVMQGAAVVGRAFWLGAVAYVAERDRADVEAAVRRLEQRHLVRRRHESSVAGDAEYVFEHALIRDVAYRSTVRTRRAEQHRRAAEWLSSLTADARDRAGTVANHYVTALENARAARQPSAELRSAASAALRAAAERAASLHSHASAAGRWAQVLDLSTAGDPYRPRAQLAHGKALAFIDDPSAATVLEAATAALIEAGDRPGAADAQSALGWLHSVAGRTVTACEHDERALDLARDAPPSPERALILSGAGANMMFLRGRREEARALLLEALAIAERLGLRETKAEALQFMGMVRVDAGDADGVRDIETALALATELSSPVALACYGNLADMRRYFGSLDDAADLHAAGERAATRFGIPVQIRRFRAGQGCAHYYSGAWDAAVAAIDAYLAAVETGSPHRLVGEVRLHRGRIRLARGERDGAVADAAAALEFARRTTEPFDLIPALAFSARVSEGVAAEGAFDELLDAIVDGQPFWGAWALPDVLYGIGGRARSDELRAALEAAAPRTPWYDAAQAVIARDFSGAARLYAAIGSRPDEAVARLWAADAAAAIGDVATARRELAAATAFFRAVGARPYVRDAGALASALPATPAAAPSRRSAR